MNDFYNNFNWMAWEKATFATFLCSTVFMVLFSVDAVNHWIFPWNQISIVAACLIPLFMVVFQYGPCWIRGKSISRELLFLPVLIILGFASTFFGKNYGFYFHNFKGTGLFLLPTVGAFTASLFILNSSKKIIFFCWFLGGLLLGVCLYGVWEFLLTGFSACTGCPVKDAHDLLFTSNPIPAGGLLIGLFAGPILILAQGRPPKEILFLVIILAAGVLIITLLGSRAAILSLPLMAVFLGVSLNRRYIYPVFALVVLFVLGYIFLESLPLFIQEKINAMVRIPVFRMEMYFFALHIFKEFPLLGIGVWTPLDEFLPSYTPILLTHIEDFNSFRWLLQTGTSFHNMILYLFVHMGALFAITYILFVISILANLIKKCANSSAGKTLVISYYTWLIGLLLPVLNVDLLMYPDVNFLFHSILGLALNLHLLVSSQAK